MDRLPNLNKAACAGAATSTLPKGVPSAKSCWCVVTKGCKMSPSSVG